MTTTTTPPSGEADTPPPKEMSAEEREGIDTLERDMGRPLTKEEIRLSLEQGAPWARSKPRRRGSLALTLASKADMPAAVIGGDFGVED